MSILSFKIVWSLVFTGLRTTTFMSSVAIQWRSKEITESQAWLHISALIKLAASIWASFTLRPQSLTCRILSEGRGLDGTLLLRPGKWRAMGSVLVTGRTGHSGASQAFLPGLGHLSCSHQFTTTIQLWHIAKVSLGASLYRGPLAKDFNTVPPPSPNQLNSARSLLRTSTRARPFCSGSDSWDGDCPEHCLPTLPHEPT